MKFYLRKIKREDTLEIYGDEILYINKNPMIYNYVRCCSYKFVGNINSEHTKWMEVSNEEILEFMNDIISYRSSDWYKKVLEANGVSMLKYKKELKSLNNFKNKIINEMSKNG